MKINDHFILRSIYGQHLLFPISRNEAGNELVALNEVGADIWKAALDEQTESEIIANIDALYGLNSGSIEEEAVRKFIETLCDHKLLYRTEEDG